MITTVTVHVCPQCGSDRIAKNGKDPRNNKQKYYCMSCKKYGTLLPSSRYSEEQKETALRVYQERASLRGVERALGIARQTVASWLKKKVHTLPPLKASLVPWQPGDVLEVDELWSFVRLKTQQQWLWIVLCRRSRQVVAFALGDRSAVTCRKLWNKIPSSYQQCCSFSDFWSVYALVFPESTHQMVGKDTGETSHVERWNNTLRQRVGRFVRKTLSFSKKISFHHMATKLFIFNYNLSVAVRI